MIVRRMRPAGRAWIAAGVAAGLLMSPAASAGPRGTPVHTPCRPAGFCPAQVAAHAVSVTTVSGR